MATTAAAARGRVAVVSGGPSGLGREGGAALHAEGHRVFACGRDREKLRRLEAAFPGVHASVWGHDTKVL